MRVVKTTCIHIQVHTHTHMSARERMHWQYLGINGGLTHTCLHIWAHAFTICCHKTISNVTVSFNYVPEENPHVKFASWRSKQNATVLLHTSDALTIRHSAPQPSCPMRMQKKAGHFPSQNIKPRIWLFVVFCIRLCAFDLASPHRWTTAICHPCLNGGTRVLILSNYIYVRVSIQTYHRHAHKQYVCMHLNIQITPTQSVA